MTIEITGTGTGNKGAELMLVAILQHLRSRYPDAKIAVDSSFGTFADRAKYGLFLNLEFPKWGRTKLAFSFLPDALKDKMGVIYNKPVNLLIDAAGFAFSDQLPVQRAIRFARKLEQAKKNGTPVILLPQALGPFDQKDSAKAFFDIVRHADLVYARDSISLKHALKATNNSPKIKIAPDFTNLVEPALKKASIHSNEVCIVPNDRMIEKASSRKSADAYLRFIEQAIREVSKSGLHPLLLVHSKPDQAIAKKILQNVKEIEVQVVHEHDPLEIKRILGESRLVIASRFHALVSALSQGVPAIGTSWSHKYQMLFEDYQCSEMLVDESFDATIVRDYLHSPRTEEEMRSKLILKGEVIQNEAKKMWQEVDAIIRH